MPRLVRPRALNLSAHRAPVSVWARSGWNGAPERLAPSRLLVGVAAAAIGIGGIRRRSWRGAIAAGLGAVLACWALTGQGDFTDTRAWLDEVLEWMPWRRRDLVEGASDQSFPASDAPSWTPMVGAGIGRSLSSR